METIYAVPFETDVPMEEIGLGQIWISSGLMVYYYIIIDGVADGKQDITDIKIFPNPASDMINIEFTTGNYSSATLEIYNIRGIRKNSIKISKLMPGINSIETSLDDYQPGTYLLIIRNGERTIRKKFVVQ
jgi:hypothetical protein